MSFFGSANISFLDLTFAQRLTAPRLWMSLSLSLFLSQIKTERRGRRTRQYLVGRPDLHLIRLFCSTVRLPELHHFLHLLPLNTVPVAHVCSSDTRTLCLTKKTCYWHRSEVQCLHLLLKQLLVGIAIGTISYLYVCVTLKSLLTGG